MIKSMRLLFLWFSLLVCSVSLSGCFAVALGAAAGAGGYAWYNGILTKDYVVTAEELHAAAIEGLETMGLTVLSEDSDRHSSRIVSQYSDGRKVAISIDAKTERSAQLKVRVGVVGDRSVSEMIIINIDQHI